MLVDNAVDTMQSIKCREIATTSELEAAEMLCAIHSVYYMISVYKNHTKHLRSRDNNNCSIMSFRTAMTTRYNRFCLRCIIQDMYRKTEHFTMAIILKIFFSYLK